MGKKNRPDNSHDRKPGGPAKPPCRLCGGTGTEVYDDIEYDYEERRNKAVKKMQRCRGCR